MTESALQSHILEFAKLHGWRRVHFRPALTSKGYRTAYTGDDGFPDLVMARNGKTIIAELKNARNKVSDEQWEWLAEFAGCSVDEFQATTRKRNFFYMRVNDCLVVGVWRPKHVEHIERLLREW